MRRPPAVAGLFYPGDRADLGRNVEELLADVPREERRAIGVIVPHAGFMYSGRCAAAVWGRIAIPGTVVLLAPNHRGLWDNPGGVGAWMRGAFATPLGDVPVAEEFLTELAARCALVCHDAAAHAKEHAIEVELPFLQVLAPQASVAGLVIAFDDWERCRDVAHALAAVVAAASKPVLLAASSDMTHYESAGAAQRKDRRALAAVERLDGRGLLETCRREGVTMCGRAPAAIVVEAARQLGARRAEVVDYRHSGLVTGDLTDVVAYAGVVIA